MCEPLGTFSKLKLVPGDSTDWIITLDDSQNPSEQTFFTVNGGASGITESSPNICLPAGAGCTLIGDNVQVIVFTPLALVNGLSGLGSRATLADFFNAGLITDGMYLDALTSGSLLSIYMAHELFHTLDTPGNMGAAGMSSGVPTNQVTDISHVVNNNGEVYGYGGCTQRKPYQTPQGTQAPIYTTNAVAIRNADTLANYALCK
jgi:hypothetical protein